MTDYQEKGGMQVNAGLVCSINHEVLLGLPTTQDKFWLALSKLIDQFAPQTRHLVQKRVELQTQIDQWNMAYQGKFDLVQYKAFLKNIGYLVQEGEDFEISTDNVDAEVSSHAGPQLVVPADFDKSLAFQAALDLVFKGLSQPSGYTEPLLHEYRHKFNQLQLTRTSENVN